MSVADTHGDSSWKITITSTQDRCDRETSYTWSM